MTKEQFIAQIAERLRCDAERAEGLAFAVLQTLRDRITAKEAADVAAQMPEGLRHFWTDNPRAGDEVDRIHREEFVGRVRRFAGLPDDVEAERAVRAVFAALQSLLGSATGMEGEAWDVFSQLPKDLKRLWLDAHLEVAT
jgi:uncharacterized protein (DUF2267 family)